jgi:RNA polymerase subunit RPABC4/transcription elongation factor Spt4
MSDGLMSPEMAEQIIWAFFWQAAHTRDRRKTMTLDQAAEIAGQHTAGQQALELDLLGRIERSLARWFTREKQDEVKAGAGADALAELEAHAKAKPGGINHATGLPESVSGLDTGRSVVSGVDLAMNVLVPPFALAAASTAWLPPDGDPAKDSDWQVLAFKAMTRHCADCKALGKLPGAKCAKCDGRGRVKIGGFMSREWDVCAPCRGHGHADGPECPTCQGRSTVSNWSEEEHATVKANANMIARTAEKLSHDGLFRARPIHKEDAEMGDLVWEDDEGNTLGFKLTYKGFQRMNEYIDKKPELKHSLHTLTYAGADVRAQAPKWAQDEYQASAG